MTSILQDPKDLNRGIRRMAAVKAAQPTRDLAALDRLMARRATRRQQGRNFPHCHLLPSMVFR